MSGESHVLSEMNALGLQTPCSQCSQLRHTAAAKRKCMEASATLAACSASASQVPINPFTHLQALRGRAVELGPGWASTSERQNWGKRCVLQLYIVIGSVSLNGRPHRRPYGHLDRRLSTHRTDEKCLPRYARIAAVSLYCVHDGLHGLKIRHSGIDCDIVWLWFVRFQR